MNPGDSPPKLRSRTARGTVNSSAVAVRWIARASSAAVGCRAAFEMSAAVAVLAVAVGLVAVGWSAVAPSMDEKKPGAKAGLNDDDSG